LPGKGFKGTNCLIEGGKHEWSSMAAGRIKTTWAPAFIRGSPFQGIALKKQKGKRGGWKRDKVRPPEGKKPATTVPAKKKDNHQPRP